MDDVVLIGVDAEHLETARRQRLGQGDRLVSFGTNFRSDDARQNPEAFPARIPCYIYAVTRGLTEAVPSATWRARFIGYRRAESFAPGELDGTRPETAIARRAPELPDQEREPEWAGYLMLSDLRRLKPGHWVPLRKFNIRGRAFEDTFVRHPLLVNLQPTSSQRDVIATRRASATAWVPVFRLPGDALPRIHDGSLFGPRERHGWRVTVTPEWRADLLMIVPRDDGSLVLAVPEVGHPTHSEHESLEEARAYLRAAVARLGDLPTEEQEAALTRAIERAQAHAAGVDAAASLRTPPLQAMKGPPIRGGLPSLGKRRP